MRVTQSMVMGSYTSRLGKVFENMDKANQKVIAQRKFLSAAEDPANAARAYQLRRLMQQNDDYLSNVESIRDTLDSIDASIMVLSKMAEETYVSLLAAKTGTMSIDERKVFANQLRTMQQTAVDALNAKFDDQFLFGGTSTKELPFTLSDDGKTLYYRGLDVSDPANQAKLEELAKETMYMDIGFGLDVKLDGSGNPVITPNSAFNVAIPGIQFLSAGGAFSSEKADNFILNMGLIADALEKDPLNGGEIDGLWEKLDAQRKQILISVTKMGSNAQFLEQRQSVLERNNDNLNSKILKVEYEDLEVLIGDFKMADYTYRAALQIGTQILTPSFIDFMK